MSELEFVELQRSAYNEIRLDNSGCTFSQVAACSRAQTSRVSDDNGYKRDDNGYKRDDNGYKRDDNEDDTSSASDSDDPLWMGVD